MTQGAFHNATCSLLRSHLSFVEEYEDCLEFHVRIDIFPRCELVIRTIHACVSDNWIL